MKKIILALCAILLCTAPLAGCGKTDGEQSATETELQTRLDPENASVGEALDVSFNVALDEKELGDEVRITSDNGRKIITVRLAGADDARLAEIESQLIAADYDKETDEDSFAGARVSIVNAFKIHDIALKDAEFSAIFTRCEKSVRPSDPKMKTVVSFVGEVKTDDGYDLYFAKITDFE